MIDFFTKEEGEKIIAAIQQAEGRTSGEIRVHLEDKPKHPAMKNAQLVFRRLKMEQTKHRNGVIIYLAPEEKQFAIYGDSGIDAVVPPNFWDNVKNLMQYHFREQQFAEGVIKAIHQIGENLQSYFPIEETDKGNELSDDISYG